MAHLIFLLLLLHLLACTESFLANKNCSVFDCGNKSLPLHYPFWNTQNEKAYYCGYPSFGLTCDGNARKPVLKLHNGGSFYVEHINYDLRTLRLVDLDVMADQNCPRVRRNVTLDESDLLRFSPPVKSLTYFFDCSSWKEDSEPVECLSNGNKQSFMFPEDEIPEFNWLGKCEGKVVAPVSDASMGVQNGFELLWGWVPGYCLLCQESSGFCGGYKKSPIEMEHLCFCTNGETRPQSCKYQPNGNYFNSEVPNTEPRGQSKSTKMKFIIIAGIASGVGCILLLLSFFFYPTISSCICGRRRISPRNPHFFWKKRTSVAYKVEVFLDNYGSHAPLRYKYSDLKKITNSFQDKLGEGGYGSVFKGKLADGHLVAVKLLSESKGNGEEFINEVSSIGRTSHVNIVTLLGFCSEGSKRALVYDFMPNGSLEKFIFSSTFQKACPLGWEKLYQIAVGIAKGLEYLHNGCNTRILHFDIKPHNILLDPNFCPKISDFGLAKLCPANISTISMLGARGTVGYIAPEVFSRNFGRVSHKSDVYSYGMMVLEMVGGRKNIDIHVENTSEIYFPQWVYKRLALNSDLDLQGIVSENDEKMARRMMIVSLWCIQSDPSNRPSMSRVVLMLEGTHEELKMPPNPFPASP